jgi:prepilin-type processing-associated H-X9-DG protein
LAINMRLYRPVIEFRGKHLLAPAATASVRANILHHPYVPLAIDVDGEEIMRRGLEPFYIAPPAGNAPDPYTTGRYWAPSTRHRGKTNVAFVGGHVLSSTDARRERWNWAYQADVGR